MSTQKLGTHEFDGACIPVGVRASSTQSAFSVGIFEWVPTKRGDGAKRGAVKVRVRGSCAHPQRVYDKAAEIAQALDTGTYTGPKVVSAF